MTDGSTVVRSSHRLDGVDNQSPRKQILSVGIAVFVPLAFPRSLEVETPTPNKLPEIPYKQLGLLYHTACIMMRFNKLSNGEVLQWARKFSSLPRKAPRSAAAPAGSFETFSRVDSTQTQRKQHQLVMPDDSELHREAMKLFLDSLVDTADNIPKRLVAPAVNPMPKATLSAASVALPMEQEEWDDTSEAPSLEAEAVVEPPAPSKPLAQAKKAPTPAAAPKKEAQSMADLEKQLLTAVENRKVRKSMKLFEFFEGKENDLPKTVVGSLFHWAVKRDPIQAYKYLKLYHQRPDINRPNLAMYTKLCYSVGTMDPKNTPTRQAYELVAQIVEDLHQLDEKTKVVVYPKLTLALASQRFVSVGVFARQLYQHMADHDHSMPVWWLKKLLALSKYNRQEDLPFHDILLRLAEAKACPHPLSTIPAVHNMFPFTNGDDMCTAMKAMLQIQSDLIESAETTDNLQLFLDLDCLESISTGAAHAGSSELIMLVWDMLEQCNYRPTTAIYENTVVALAIGAEDLEPALGAMIAMKEEGHEVSRALIRSFSLAVRSQRINVDNALHLVRTKSELRSIDTLNAVMSCYAERGNSWEVAQVMQLMESSNIEPNVDTFSFCVESLGKNIHRRALSDNGGMVQQYLELADSSLSKMEEAGISPSSDVVRQYAELLCLANEVNTATTVVRDCLETMPESVNSKTLYRVAIANAERGEFEAAKELASHVSDNIPILDRKIRSLQQRHEHLGGVRNHA
eukprot:Nitzschia sp. Nitz4//scaffold13_size275219//148561//150866//NITZ4_000881-RA/size275219-augustus-gene-0.235-mRNA-1//1//CDS//3329536035//3020//frame0